MLSVLQLVGDQHHQFVLQETTDHPGNGQGTRGEGRQRRFPKTSAWWLGDMYMKQVHTHTCTVHNSQHALDKELNLLLAVAEDTPVICRG